MSTEVLEHVRGNDLAKAMESLHLNPNERFRIIVTSEEEQIHGYTEDGVPIVEDNELADAMHHYQKSSSAEEKMDVKTFLLKAKEEGLI